MGRPEYGSALTKRHGIVQTAGGDLGKTCDFLFRAAAACSASFINLATTLNMSSVAAAVAKGAVITDVSRSALPLDPLADLSRKVQNVCPQGTK